MRLGIISDAHGNLPALQAVADRFGEKGVDQIIHLGDAIAIGPQPRECLTTLLNFKGIRCVMGNHEDWYAYGLPHPRPGWMTDGELEHQFWVHEQLGPHFRALVGSWPWRIRMEVEGFSLVFLHYALQEDGCSFKSLIRDTTVDALDALFDTWADCVFYGHTHLASDLKGRARYLNPGSLGCQKSAVAPYLLLDIVDGKLEIQHQVVAYEDRALYQVFESRAVPEREFIYKAFFGGRFPPAQGERFTNL
jgi:putative phosphoesterase